MSQVNLAVRTTLDMGAPLDPFAEIGDLLQGAPSRDAWLALCDRYAAALELDRLRALALAPSMIEALSAWPSRIRTAPLDWLGPLSTGQLPAEALSMASALDLSKLWTAAFGWDEMKRFSEWFRALPADGPALEGLSFGASLRELPDGPDIPEAYSSFHEPILSSPALRLVRVLDLSHPYGAVISRRSGGNDNLHALSSLSDHEGWMKMWVSQLSRWCPSPRLEVLDLYGVLYNTTEWEQIKPATWPSLGALDIGGADAPTAKMLRALLKGRKGRDLHQVPEPIRRLAHGTDADRQVLADYVQEHGIDTRFALGCRPDPSLRYYLEGWHREGKRAAPAAPLTKREQDSIADLVSAFDYAPERVPGEPPRSSRDFRPTAWRTHFDP